MPRALATLALVACTAPAGSGPATPVDTVPAWLVRPAGGTQAIDPGVPVDDPLLDIAGCATCHAAIVDEWSRSRHALAWTNGIFQREYAARPQAWCVNCHAPLTTQQGVPARVGTAIVPAVRPRAAQGVDCATCHVRGGKLVSARRGAKSPHETVRDPSFGTPAFCADCHQFTFPVLSAETGAALAMTRHPMQDTVASFAAGPYARDRDGCLSCHGSQHGHAFAGAHDRAMREAAVEVTWCRASPGELAVDVRNAAAGHAIPTGDIHRHMYLRVWRSSAPEAMFQAFFGRRFEPAAEGGKRTIWDSTIAPGATKHLAVAIGSLGGDDDEPVNLELRYVYIENEFPRPSRHVRFDEPTYEAVVDRRTGLADLVRCAP